MKQTLLKDLELGECDSLEDLDKQFRSLIKKYHPDRNSGNPNWANQKSHTIITAYQKLKAMVTSSVHIEKRTLGNNIIYKKSNFKKSKVKIAFQILEGNINYAIPVNKISRIILCDKKNMPNTFLWVKAFYSEYCDSNYQISDQINWQDFRYLIVLAPEIKKTILAISNKVNIGNIREIDINSAGLYPAHDLSGVFIKHKNYSCFCPEDLAFNEFINCA